MIVLLAAALTAGYVALVLTAAYYVRRSQVIVPGGPTVPFVSVLIAARNEENTLPACLEAVRRQSYPADRYEVVVADDHSTDRTAEIAREYGVRCTSAASPGKAGALHSAIIAARGSVLVVTDADCRPPREWVENLAGQLQDGKVGIVCGVTTVAGSSLLARIQAIDWLLLLGVAAGFSEMGVPVTAMGNNMAFLREAYNRVGGYPALPASVTEDYALFRAIHRTTSWRARLILHPLLQNVTLPVSSWREVIAQRKRWARGGIDAEKWVYLIYALLFATHLCLPILFFLAPAAAVLILAAKVGADAMLIRIAVRRLKVQPLGRAFPLFQIYLFAYVIVLPLLLAASPKIEWKGRRH